MRVTVRRAAFAMASILSVSVGLHSSLAAGPAPFMPAPPPAKVEINLDKAAKVPLPKPAKPLTPAPFKTSDLKKGWLVEIPGNRPIATPAYWNGMLFVGGGYGSHEFYAFDARTGKLIWQIHTADDGPSAAVVENGLVAFNTESCTVMVVEAQTGKLVWQEWLGDPLMSQPAIANGKLYIAYPSTGAPHQGAFNNVVQTAQQNVQAQTINLPASKKRTGKETFAAGMAHAKGGGHVMLCADLRTGKHLWTQDITGDVQSAPVVSGNKLLFTCFDGTAFCLDANNGSVTWKKAASGTSAPVATKDGKVIFTSKFSRAGKSYEGTQRMHADKGDFVQAQASNVQEADYLSKEKGGSILGLGQKALNMLDSAVGFGGGGPAAAKLSQAEQNVGVGTVAAGWAFQGSRAAVRGDRVLNAQRNLITMQGATNGTVGWQAAARGRGVSESNQVFTPPSLGAQNMYLCSSYGHVLSLSQQTGKVNFMYSTGVPVTFQPALANGNMYIGTSDGKLMCLETGSADADGWTAWGGNAQHNKAD